jgi:hypothetical protein
MKALTGLYLDISRKKTDQSSPKWELKGDREMIPTDSPTVRLESIPGGKKPFGKNLVFLAYGAGHWHLEGLGIKTG